MFHETMLRCIDKFLFSEMDNNIVMYNRFQHFTNDGCQTNWSVIFNKSTTALLVY